MSLIGHCRKTSFFFLFSVLLSLGSLALLELGLKLADYAEPTALFVSEEGDSEYWALNPEFPSTWFRNGLARPLKPAYIRKEKSDRTYRVFV